MELQVEVPSELYTGDANDITEEPLHDNINCKLQTCTLEDLFLEDVEERQARNIDIEWFHGAISRTESELVLRKEGATNGKYLVRESVSHPGSLILCLCFDGNVFHYQITKIGDAFFSINNSPVIHGIDKVIEHYKVENRGLPHKLTSFCRNVPPPAGLCRYGPTNILHKAVREGNAHLVNRILADPLCPDVNSKDSKGSTVLHDTCYHGLEVIATSLLRKGANANLRDSSGYTPLHRACSGNYPNLIKLLIKYGGADPLEIRHLNGMQPLHEAAMLGHTKCVQMLLSLGAPAWPQDLEKVTPYQTALRFDHQECAKVLLRHRAAPAKSKKVNWYHGDLRRKDTVKIFSDAGFKDGMFLVRNSTKQLDWFVLALVHQQSVQHYEIKQHESKMYHLDDGPLLESLPHVVDFYCLFAEGLPCRLKSAVSKTGVVKEMNIEKPYPAPDNLLYSEAVSQSAPSDSLNSIINSQSGGMNDLNRNESTSANQNESISHQHKSAFTNKKIPLLPPPKPERKLNQSNVQTENDKIVNRGVHTATNQNQVGAPIPPAKPKGGNRGTPVNSPPRVPGSHGTPVNSPPKIPGFHGMLVNSARVPARPEHGGTPINSPPRLPAKPEPSKNYPCPPPLPYRSRTPSPKSRSPTPPRKGQIDVKVVYSESTKRRNRPERFQKKQEFTEVEPVATGDAPQQPTKQEKIPPSLPNISPTKEGQEAPPIPSLSPPMSPVETTSSGTGSYVTSADAGSSVTSSSFLTETKTDQEIRVVTKSELKLTRELGQGEFGSVYEAKWKPKDKNQSRRLVAVKTLNPHHMINGKEQFLWEAKVMMNLQHSCIVKLIDLCELKGMIMIVQELITNGSLLDYLLDYPEAVEVKTDLYLWAAQIASGMMYLEEKKFVHRDLAARNILLASKDQIKISDFGLSRAVGAGSDYYQASKGGRWPIKWYAPECVNYGTFSHASDVWSYGITLWEMFSFGKQPYEHLEGTQVIQMLDNGGRLEKPNRCPDNVYEIMLKCWKHKPAERPTFQSLNIIFSSDPEYAGIYERVPQR